MSSRLPNSNQQPQAPLIQCNHTLLSEEEVLSSKNIFSFTQCFPVNKNRRSSTIDLNTFKSDLEIQIKNSSATFLTQVNSDEEIDDDDSKDRKYLKQRRDNLLREVWEKQYHHNMQTWDRAVVNVADSLAKTGKLASLNKALKLNPHNSSYYLTKADLLRQAKKYNLAICHIEHVLNTMDQNVEIEFVAKVRQMQLDYLTAWAHECQLDKNYNQALSLFTEIIDNSFCSEELHLRTQLQIAECLLATNQRKACLELLNYLCSRWNNRCDLLLMRAKLHGKSLNASDQYADVKNALDIDPLHENAIQYYSELETKSQALYEDSIKLATNNQFWAAHQKISLAITIVPDKVEFYLLRGMLKRCVQEFIPAIDDLSKVLTWDLVTGDSKIQSLHNSRCYEAKFQITLTLNDFACDIAHYDLKQALVILNHIIDTDAGILDESSHVWANRGCIYTQLGHFQKAFDDYKRAYQHNEDVAEKLGLIRCKLGDEAYHLGDYIQALEQYNQALIWEDNCIWYHIKRCHTRYMLRSLDGAKYDLKAAAELCGKLMSSHSDKYTGLDASTPIVAIKREINKLSMLLLGKEYFHNKNVPNALSNFSILV